MTSGPSYVTVQTKDVPAPRSGRTRTGYGSKIPNDRMVRLEGRWRRVYTTIWSNAGTSWVLWNGKKHIVRNFSDETTVDTNPWSWEA